jgi:hypothetical protein
MCANVELARSIYARWGRGDWSSFDWADPEIEFVIADGPDPQTVRGIDQMVEAWREFLAAFSNYATVGDEFRELEDGRVLVLLTPHGRGKASGVDLAANQSATVMEMHNGVVARIEIYFNRRNALADLGLER